MALRTSFTLKTLRVLVVDDDPTQRALVASLLGPEVARLVEAENGEAGLERTREEPFDLVLADLEMPRMNGFEFVGALRARDDTRFLPVIVVTSRDDTMAIERAFAAGATSFVMKPLNWAVFRHQVSYVARMAEVERDTRAAVTRAEELSRLKDDSLAVIDHEIRTALNSIQGFGEVLATEAFGPLGMPAYRDYAEGILKSSARLSATYRLILDASQVLSDQVDMEERFADAGEIAEGALAALDPDLDPSRVWVDIRMADGARLFCDPALLARALVAVLDNALSFSGDGPVVLSAAVTRRGQFRFDVSDEGPGIAPDRIADITKPFNLHGRDTARAGRNPLGLGLSVASAILKRHGGHLAIASELGRGTDVFLMLPPPRLRRHETPAANQPLAVSARFG